MKSLKFILTLLFFVISVQKAGASCTIAITINTAITASTVDYLERAETRAIENKCDSIFVRLNTPGGSLHSTRQIVERILASSVPYLCLITPSGGHAGSAGAIILQACHVNGGLAATNIGAATPILGTGKELPADLRNKLINDTVSWLEGVTELRGRSKTFSKEIITEAKSVSSEAAVKLKALDILANNENDFLAQSKDRLTRLGEKKDQAVFVGDLQEFLPDLRYKILSFVADPEFAYILFMGSLALLYFEITHPGMMVPGVVGGIGLVLSFVAFDKLAVTWGGLALILLGVVFLILEIFVTSFGILGIGGLIAVFLGSLFLFNTEVTGYSLPLSLILSVVGVLAVFFAAIGFLALKTLKYKSRDNDMDLQEAVGEVRTLDHHKDGRAGQIEIIGETWNFVSEESLKVKDTVRVISRRGLTLNVKKST